MVPSCSMVHRPKRRDKALGKALLRTALLLADIKYGNRSIEMPKGYKKVKIKNISVNNSRLIFKKSIHETPSIDISDCKSIKDILLRFTPRSDIMIKDTSNKENWHEHPHINSTSGLFTTHMTHDDVSGELRHEGRVSAADGPLQIMWDLIVNHKSKRRIHQLTAIYPRRQVIAFNPRVARPVIARKTLHFKLDDQPQTTTTHVFEHSSLLLGMVLKRKRAVSVVINQKGHLTEILDETDIRKYWDVFSLVMRTAMPS